MNARLTVNGRGYTVVLDPRESLLDVLRERLDLTGTKKGCDQGPAGRARSTSTAGVCSAV
jgi:xanthine dehydrogenase YagT iron-sulfur-binding subunit